MSDPIMGVVSSMSSETIKGLAQSAGIENLDNHSYGGLTGEDAFALEFANLSFSGGLRINDDGRLEYDPAALDNIGTPETPVTPVTPVTPSTTTGMGVLSAFKSAVQTSGTMTRIKDGEEVTVKSPVTDTERAAAITSAKEGLSKLTAEEISGILSTPTLLEEYRTAGIISSKTPTLTTSSMLRQTDWDAQGFKPGDIVLMDIDGVKQLVMIDRYESTLNTNAGALGWGKDEREGVLYGVNLSKGGQSPSIVYTTGPIKV